MVTKDVDQNETTLSPQKNFDKESKISANEIFYKSHVSGFNGIK